jgi:hypothetical protein
MKATLIRWLVVAVVCVGLSAGSTGVFTEAREAAGGCICPLIYAPVTCDGGKTYSNQCVANCHHARNCVPSGGAIQ